MSRLLRAVLGVCVCVCVYTDCGVQRGRLRLQRLGLRLLGLQRLGLQRLGLQRLGLQRTCNHTCGAGLTCTKARTEKDLATVLAAVPYSADARPDPTDLSTQAT